MSAIYIVEDEPELAALVADYVRASGDTPTVFADGALALAAPPEPPQPPPVPAPAHFPIPQQPPAPPAPPTVPAAVHAACADKASGSGSALSVTLAAGETMRGVCQRSGGSMVFQLKEYRNGE